MEEYISAAQIDLSEDLPLFRALATPRSKEMVRSQGISYTRARELVKDAFRGLTDVSKLSLHSLRAGGPPQQLMPEFLTDYSNVMDVGRAKTPRMAILKIILILAYWSHDL